VARKEGTRVTMDADDVLENLPYLRRYARALTGSQRIGDDYVRFCLETMLQEPQRIEHGHAKRDVFRLFHQVWNALRPTPEDERDGPDVDQRQRIAHGLAALPAIERMVLLLTALEEFSLADTAFILGLSKEEVSTYLSRAREDIRLETAVDILIIEDEPVIAMELSRIVESMGHKVCGVAARQRAAVALALECKPALVLADIQLKDGESGISAVREILAKLAMPVIFVTGFPERLLTGDALEPAFVITKPFDPETLQIAIGQALTVAGPSSRRHPENTSMSV